MTTSLAKCDELQRSFFNLAELSTVKCESYQICHNLSHWHLTLSKIKIKNGQLIIDIVVPYREMTFTVTETANDTNFFNQNVARLTFNTDDKNVIRVSNLFNYIVSFILFSYFNHLRFFNLGVKSRIVFIGCVDRFQIYW